MEWALTETLGTALAAGGLFAVASLGIVVLPWTDAELHGVWSAPRHLVAFLQSWRPRLAVRTARPGPVDEPLLGWQS